MYKYLIICLALLSCTDHKTSETKVTEEKKIPIEHISLWETVGHERIKKIISTEYAELNADGIPIGLFNNPYSQTIDSFDSAGYLVKRIVDGYFYEKKPKYSSYMHVIRTIDSVLTEVQYNNDTLYKKQVAIPTGARTYTYHYYYPYNGGLFHSRTAFITVDDRYRRSKAKFLDYTGKDTIITGLEIEYSNEEYFIIKNTVDGKVVQIDTGFENIALKKNTKGKAIVEKRLNKLQHSVDTTDLNINYEYY